MRYRNLAAIGFLMALVACDGPMDHLPAAPDPPEDEDRPPPVSVAEIEGYPEPGELRTGWIWGRNGEAVRLTYEIQNGLAIWEGDIILGRVEEIASTRDELEAGPARGVVRDGEEFRWPSGVVPYEIDPDLPNQSRVTQAIEWIHDGTPGITLVSREDEEDFVRFQPGSGCSSAIGRQGGEQSINLAPGCSVGNTAHEILHALGMYHEHSRCDRDDYVIIHEDEIEEDRVHNFDKHCDGATDIDEYDEGSIMHYPPHAFAIGSDPTIESRRGRDLVMGQRDSVGPTDAATIAELYGKFNLPPVAVIAPLASSYPEGSPVPFKGSGSYDEDDNDAILTFSWNFGDGTCEGADPPSICFERDPAHTYAVDGVYPVRLTVSDGFAEGTAETTVNILNVAPVVDAGPGASVDEGSEFTRTGSFIDPGADTWSAEVDYGDGSGPKELTLDGKGFELRHTYVDNGLYTVTVEVDDGAGGSGTDQLEVTVHNVAPFVDAGSDVVVPTGETFAFSGAFSDPGIEDDPWTWEIDWGFGPATTGSTEDQTAPIEASRQVCTAGEYPVTLSVTDKDQDTGIDQIVLTVPHLPLDIDVQPGGGDHNPVNLARRGLLPVAILSSPSFDATTVDPASIRIGEDLGGETPVAVRNNGELHVGAEDVTGNGLLDLVVHFDIQEMVQSGDLGEATEELVLQSFLNDACTNMAGHAAVTVRP